jgi:hypothetical protein
MIASRLHWRLADLNHTTEKLCYLPFELQLIFLAPPHVKVHKNDGGKAWSSINHSTLAGFLSLSSHPTCI